MSRDTFFTALCNAFGWTPTQWRLAVMNYWADQEGMPFDLTFNPFATTQNGDLNLNYNNGFGPGNWNSVPVRVYRNEQAGVIATYQTMNNGYYPNVLRCFEDQIGYQEAVGPRDFTSWVGSASYGQRLVNFMNTTTADKGEEMDPRVDNILQTLQRSGVQEWADVGNEPLRMTLGKIQDTLARIEIMLGKIRMAAPAISAGIQQAYSNNNQLVASGILLPQLPPAYYAGKEAVDQLALL